jgi:uncharacterized protein YndB with AHSA1/START domain
MSSVEFRVSSVIPASPNRIYGAWMDERQHSAISGTRIRIDPWVGGRVHGWDGAIFASHLRLETGRRIALAFRTTDFPVDAPDSYVDITLEPAMGGTQVTVVQKAVPGALKKKLEAHWKKSYLDPMKRFFGNPEGMRDALRKASRNGHLEVSSLSAERQGPERGPEQVFKSSPGTLLAGEEPATSSAKKHRISKGLKLKSRVLARSDAAKAPEKRAPVAAVKTAAIQKAAKKASKPMTNNLEPANEVAQAVAKAAEETAKAAKNAAEAVQKAAKKATKKVATAAKKATKKVAARAKKAAKKAVGDAKKTTKQIAKSARKAAKKASPKKAAKKASPKKAAKKASPKKAAKKAAPKKAAKKAAKKRSAPKKAAKKAAPKKRRK